jgi:hypothetical protein
MRSKGSTQKSSVTRTQDTEDRALYEQAGSIGTAPSLVDIDLDNKDNLVRMENVVVSTGKK